MATEAELVAKLHGEGFRHAYIWEDAPNACYPGHTHPTETIHIILWGEITVTAEGKSRTYGAGEQFAVPAGAVHSARAGRQGCRYVIGER